MPIFRNGKPAVALRWIDAAGTERHVVQVHWIDASGVDHLVWDGTVPAMIDAPVLTSSLVLPTPTVRAGATIAAPLLLAGVQVPTPVPGGGGGVDAPVLGATVVLLAPTVQAGATINAPVLSSAVELLAPGVGVDVAGTVNAPPMTVMVELLPPQVQVPATVEAPVLTLATALNVPEFHAGAAIAAPVLQVATGLLAPTVGAGATVAAPALGVTAQLLAPEVRAGATIAAPVLEIAATMPAPVVAAVEPGVDYADNFNRSDGVLGSNWTYRNGTSYPRVSGNQVAVGGTSDGYYECTWVNPCLTSEQYAECDIMTAGSRSSGIMLRYSTSGVGAILTWIGTKLAIFTTTGWQGAGGVNQTGDIEAGTLTGKRLRFTAIGNVYTGYVDGVKAIEWIDSGAVVPTTGRLGGLALQRANFNNSGQLDNWAFGDLDLTPTPGYVEAPVLTTAVELLAPTVTTEVPAWSPMGMDKSGTQSCPTSYVAVNGWTPRSGYPGTSIVSNALVADGPATVTVYGKITISGGTLPAVAFRIKRNGVVIYTSAKSGSTQSGSVSVTLAAGDILTMEAEASTYASTPTIQAGATNTYLYFE
ncbi:hypothetical protein [Rhodococcus zopfii]|uniref:hypothetical protein n=1 Tax=Rhodococcus zopfii TaxID=43772 RepID=UPI0035276461